MSLGWAEFSGAPLVVDRHLLPVERWPVLWCLFSWNACGCRPYLHLWTYVKRGVSVCCLFRECKLMICHLDYYNMQRWQKNERKREKIDEQLGYTYYETKYGTYMYM